MKRRGRVPTPWLALLGHGLLANALFAVAFTIVRYALPIDGWIDIVVWLTCSLGSMALARPSGAFRTAALAAYNLVSNLYLPIVIVYSVFGLAL